MESRHRVRPRRRARCSASATASRSSARPGCCPGALLPNAVAALHLPPGRPRGRAHATRRSRARATRASGSRSRPSTRPGRYYAPDEQLDALEADGQVVLRYADGPELQRLAARHRRASATRRGNVFGLMPHPEHAVDALTAARPTACGSSSRWRRAWRARPCLRRPRCRRVEDAVALGLTRDEYDARRRQARPRAEPGRAGDVLAAVERALRLQALQEAAAHAADRGRRASCIGPGRERGRGRRRRRPGRARSRSSRTTTRARSSRSRARRRASAASCATSSRSARGRSPCSTRCASASRTERALALPARPRGRGHRPLRQLDRRADGRRRGLLRGALRARTASSTRWRSGSRRARAPDAQRGGRRRQRRRAVRRVDRPRRHRRRVGAGQRRARRADDADKRPTVQVGDPFEEKKLLECSLELLERGLLVALQDLGAAGLTSSASEMASKGGVGIDLDVARVPLREADMEPFEIMVSESQERMLCVVRARAASTRCSRCARRWEVHGTAIGEVTDTRARARPARRRARRRHAGRRARRRLPALRPRARAPARGAPLYPPPAATLAAGRLAARRAARAAGARRTSPRAARCSSSTTRSCSRAPCAGPRRPTPRCSRSRTAARSACRSTATAAASPPTPTRGTVVAALECAANLACVGAEPLGTTNNLNFGNPEKPHIAWQLTEAVRGLGDACRALGRRSSAATSRSTTRAPTGRSTRRRSSAWSAACPTRARAGRLGFAPRGRRRSRSPGWNRAPSLAASELAKLRGEPLPDGLPRVRPRARASRSQDAVRDAVRAGDLPQLPRHRRGRLPRGAGRGCLAGGLGAAPSTSGRRTTCGRTSCSSARAPGGFVVSGPRAALERSASGSRSTSSGRRAATRSSSTRAPGCAGRSRSCATPTARWPPSSLLSRGFVPFRPMHPEGRTSGRRTPVVERHLPVPTAPGGPAPRDRRLLTGLALLVLAGPASASSLFADGFESGDFSAWSQVQTAGDGAAVVQSAVVRAGAVSAQLSESATAGSKAYVRKTLSASQQELTVSGDFQRRPRRARAAATSPSSACWTRAAPGWSASTARTARAARSASATRARTSRPPASSRSSTWATISVHVDHRRDEQHRRGARSTGRSSSRSTTASLGTAGVQAHPDRQRHGRAGLHAAGRHDRRPGRGRHDAVGSGQRHAADGRRHAAGRADGDGEPRAPGPAPSRSPTPTSGSAATRAGATCGADHRGHDRELRGDRRRRRRTPCASP